jgi:hypothetical protein
MTEPELIAKALQDLDDLVDYLPQAVEGATGRYLDARIRDTIQTLEELRASIHRRLAE